MKIRSAAKIEGTEKIICDYMYMSLWYTQIELIENCLNHSRILLMFNIQHMLVLIDCYRLCTLTSRLFLVLRPEQYPSVQDFQTSMTYKSPSLDRTT